MHFNVSPPVPESEEGWLTVRAATIFAGGFLAGLLTACVMFGAYLSQQGQKCTGGGAMTIAASSSASNNLSTQSMPRHDGGTDVVANAHGHSDDDIESLQYFWPRASVLVTLMFFQSSSQVILLHFARLIEQHPSLVGFLTMIVGLGGNVGGQSLVLTVRRIAKGEPSILTEQLFIGARLALLLSPLAFMRAYLCGGVMMDICITIAAAVLVIPILATCLGTLLPKMFQHFHFDPAHAEPVNQVLMDILGVAIVCVLGRFFVAEDFVDIKPFTYDVDGEPILH
jgi:hypothetical protein